MATKTEDRKIYEPETIDETPLPEAVIWENIVDAPKSVADLNPADGAALEAATIAIDGLGALAYEDLVNELNIAAGAVTNAKIAVDAIQGAVIAAGAITVTKISDGAIETPKLAAGAVTATTIATGAITATKIDTGAVTATKIASEAIVAGKIAAGAIDGITITGSIVRTASSGIRAQLNNSSASLEIYDASRLRMQAYQQGLTFWDSSGNNVADIYAGSTGGLLITTSNSGNASRSIHIQAGSSGVASLGIGGTTYIYANGPTAEVYLAKDLIPNQAGLDIGSSSGYSIGSIYTQYLFMDPIGYVYADGSNDFLPYGCSITKLATGRYRINGVPFGNYVAVVQPVAAAAKVWSIESQPGSTFIVRIANFAGSLEDNDFMFILIPQS